MKTETAADILREFGIAPPPPGKNSGAGCGYGCQYGHASNAPAIPIGTIGASVRLMSN